LRAFGEFNDAAARAYGGWVTEMTERARQALDEGDLRADLDPLAVAETIVGLMLGTELLANATTAGADVLQRVARTWKVLLPGIVSQESLSYFEEFVSRESMRHSPASLAD
jgi:hypothetical protein